MTHYDDALSAADLEDFDEDDIEPCAAEEHEDEDDDGKED